VANPTTNYGFVLPSPTDLVTDLPADFDVALQGVDTRLKALQPGTTLGDIAYSSATANTNTRLPIGTSGQVLAVSGGGVPEWTTAGTPSYTWTSYTPTVGAATGSITTSSATGKYIQIGKFIFVVCQAVITNNGTGGGSYLSVSAPFANVGDRSTGLWRENAATGNAGQVSVSGSSFLLATMANGYPAASGYTIFFGIGYEVA
jgi:hypothetical protein